MTYPLTQNDPKKIICRIPVLSAGDDSLKIRRSLMGTCCSKNLGRLFTAKHLPVE
ncbi:MAG: hypothetical protein LBJ67_10590 [Planctomycetaceae bacterium]|nr:hypothetical protein [Planctomycetaceae bacterium]